MFSSRLWGKLDLITKIGYIVWRIRSRSDDRWEQVRRLIRWIPGIWIYNQGAKTVIQKIERVTSFLSYKKLR